jgi:hypothetical protein
MIYVQAIHPMIGGMPMMEMGMGVNPILPNQVHMRFFTVMTT